MVKTNGFASIIAKNLGYYPLSVHPAQNFKIQRQSLPAGTVGWPSGSLMTPVLLKLIFAEPEKYITSIRMQGGSEGGMSFVYLCHNPHVFLAETNYL